MNDTSGLSPSSIIMARIENLISQLLKARNSVLLIRIPGQGYISARYYSLEDFRSRNSLKGELIDILTDSKLLHDVCYFVRSSKKRFIILSLSADSNVDIGSFQAILSCFSIDFQVDNFTIILRKYFDGIIILVIVSMINNCNEIIRCLLYKAFEFKHEINIYFLSPDALEKILLKGKIKGFLKRLVLKIDLISTFIKALLGFMEIIKHQERKLRVSRNNIDNIRARDFEESSFMQKNPIGKIRFEEKADITQFEFCPETDLNKDNKCNNELASKNIKGGVGGLQIYFDSLLVGDELVMINDLLFPSKVALIPRSLLVWLKESIANKRRKE